MSAERLLDALASSGGGAREWSVHVHATRRLNLGARDGQTGNAHAPLSITDALQASYLLVWQDGRVSRGALERRQLDRVPEEAVARARAAAYDDPDAARVLGPAIFPDVPLSDAGPLSVLAGDLSPIAERLLAVRQTVGRDGLRTWSASFACSETRERVVTSAGLSVESEGTHWSWHVVLDGELGAGRSARALEPVEEYLDTLARLAGNVRRLREPAASLPAGVVPVLLHPDVVEEFVLTTLLHNLEGRTVARREGLFRPEQFGSGEPVLREDITIRLDPTEPLRAGSYRFTTEGLPAADCRFLDRGRLVTPVLDLKYARRLGLRPTALPYGLDTLHLEGPEVLPWEEGLGRATGGVLVLNVLGVHTQDPGSGDFSLSAPQALAVGSGGLDGRVRATLSGNLLQILRSEHLGLVAFEGEERPGLLFACRVESK